jgi:hypothetical protein
MPEVLQFLHKRGTHIWTEKIQDPPLFAGNQTAFLKQETNIKHKKQIYMAEQYHDFNSTSQGQS